MRSFLALVDELAADVPPASGAVVMGTGIVSVALDLDHRDTLSEILLAIAVAVLLGLFGIFLRRVRWQRPRWLDEARTPAALTAVAGTGVVGSRLTVGGVGWAGWLLLVIAVAAWLRLVPTVLRHWRTPTVGVSFMLTVATESLAVLSALLALEEHRRWLAVASVAPLLLGIAAYLFVLARIDLRQLLTGLGDHWVFGGALAIVTLACARTTAALDATGGLDGWHGFLQDATLGLWAAAVLWLPLLLVGEVLRPRLGYDVRRWATVFPFGMYAACSFAAGEVAGIAGIEDFGRAWIWVALAVWAVVFAGLLRLAVSTVVRTVHAAV